MFGFSQELLWLAEASVFGRSFIFGRIFGYFDNRRFGFGRRSKFSFRFNTGLCLQPLQPHGAALVARCQLTFSHSQSQTVLENRPNSAKKEGEEGARRMDPVRLLCSWMLGNNTKTECGHLIYKHFTKEWKSPIFWILNPEVSSTWFE